MKRLLAVVALILAVLTLAHFSYRDCVPFSDVLMSIWHWITGFSSAVWVGLQWPHAVLLVFIIFVSVFTPELKSILARVTDVTRDGVKISPSQTAQSQDESVRDASAVVDNPAHNYFSNEIANALRDVDAELATISNDERFEKMRLNLAFWRAMYFFENTYSIIFGGQIKLLKLLNERGDVGVGTVELDRLWADHQESLKPAIESWTLIGYLSFLFSRDLIVINESTKVISITTRGTEFMLWLTRFGRSEERPW